MWWEAIPSGATVMACFLGASGWVYMTNKLFLKNPYKRKLNTANDIHYYLRDSRISGTGKPYQQVGLENLSLEEELCKDS